MPGEGADRNRCAPPVGAHACRGYRGRVPELTLSRFVETWRLDPVALAAVLLLAGLYVAGVRRRRRRGERWPVPRTLAFVVLGLGTVVIATMSSLAAYDQVLFWSATVQNVLLGVVAPLGLALGDPLGLAGWDLRALRLLTYPLVSSVLVLVSELTIYFTPYFATALHNDAVRQLMHLQLLLTGSLFILPMLTRQEVLPAWCTHPVRAALVFFDGLLDSVPGIVVMTSGTLVAGRWYAAHHLAWEPSLRYDQMLGGGLMVAIAELVGLPFLIAVFAEWWRAERARTAELDARLDRELPAAAVAPGPQASPEGPGLTRPWWETDGGEIGRRIRRES
jgi:cytochrome c oxidase assembly factor CtaG